MALAPAAGAAPAASAAQVAPVTINVYQQPGENPEAFARRVAELVREEEQKRRRRGFRDDF